MRFPFVSRFSAYSKRAVFGNTSHKREKKKYVFQKTVFARTRNLKLYYNTKLNGWECRWGGGTIILNLFVRRTLWYFTIRIKNGSKRKTIDDTRTRRKNKRIRRNRKKRDAAPNRISGIDRTCFVPCSGLVGPAPGHSPADRRPVHVHRRPTVPVHQPAAQRGLDAPDQVSADQRLGSVRMSDIHHAAHQPIHSPTGGRWVSARARRRLPDLPPVPLGVSNVNRILDRARVIRSWVRQCSSHDEKK